MMYMLDMFYMLDMKNTQPVGQEGRGQECCCHDPSSARQPQRPSRPPAVNFCLSWLYTNFFRSYLVLISSILSIHT